MAGQGRSIVIIAAPINSLREFFKMEAAGGILLVLASALAWRLADGWLCHALLGTKAEVRIGDFSIAKPFTLWINDGLMAVFFLLVGLEIKRELKEGELSSRDQALLPAIAAIGGMAVPAAIYVLLNLRYFENLNGWAIPSATDIAFSLGVLALLGSRAPLSLKVLLTAIAIFDDLGAIVIIAVFYTADLSLLSLSLAAVALAVLLILNLRGVRNIAPYAVVGAFLWVCVLKSGVHATLAGVALAAAIPLAADAHGHSPLKSMEHGLHPGSPTACCRSSASPTPAFPSPAWDGTISSIRSPWASPSACSSASRPASMARSGSPSASASPANPRAPPTADLRDGDPLRHWLHHEPVHRQPRLAPLRLRRGDPPRRARRLSRLRRGRLPPAPLRRAAGRATGGEGGAQGT